MDEQTINFLGENDFEAAMYGDCLKWRKEYVKEGDITAPDGTRLHYYHAIPEGAKAAVVIVHGLCEFFGKYHEMSWYLFRAGYAFFFMENRGHGLSGGKLEAPDSDVVYIDDYDTYVSDLDCFVESIVNPLSGSLRKIILGHSMGGAITALYLEEQRGDFSSALLSSPMFKMYVENLPAWQKAAFKCTTILFGRHKKIAPGERHFDNKPAFEASCLLSRARYDYVFRLRTENPAFRTNCTSCGWVMASFDATRRILRDASKISIPVTIFSAGKDTLVDTASHDEFASKLPGTVILRYEDSRHEIFNAGDHARMSFFRDILGCVSGCVSGDGSL